MKKREFYKIIKNTKLHRYELRTIIGKTEWDKKVNYVICKTFGRCPTWNALVSALNNNIDELHVDRSIVNKYLYVEHFHNFVETYLPENEKKCIELELLDIE